MKRRCASNERSSRASKSSKVSPSSFSSSSGPASARRWCRLLAEISLAVAVIVRSGRSTRPAISQPSAIDSATIAPSASKEYHSRLRRSLER